MTGQLARIIRTLAAAAFLLAGPLLFAQRLPITSFSASDGLPGGGIGRIMRDAHGFLWFCSSEGVARFDGHAFIRFGADTGFPTGKVHDLLQTRDGLFWFATDQGLFRSDLSHSEGSLGSGRIPILPVRRPDSQGAAAGESASATCLLEDREGVLWCGSTAGLFRVDRQAGGAALQPVDLGIPIKSHDDPVILALAPNGRGGLWIGTWSGLYAWNSGAKVVRFTMAEGLPFNEIRDIVTDRSGVLWVGTRKGIAGFRVAPGVPRLDALARYSAANGMENDDVLTLHLAESGRILVGTQQGVSVLDHGSLRNFGPAQGLKGPVLSVAEAANGDVWLGIDGGVQRWTRDGLTTFLPRAGPDSRMDVILEDRQGTLVSGGLGNGTFRLNRMVGDRLESGRIPLPPEVRNPGWGWIQPLLQDHAGGWWLATQQGLCRFEATASAKDLPRARRLKTYRVDQVTSSGSQDVFSIFEDSRGDIWFSISSPIANGLGRWRRSTDRIEGLNGTGGLAEKPALATVFAEDQAANLWMGFNDGSLARFRNGRFERFGREQGAPSGWVRSLLKDSSGRMWAGASVGGVGIVEDPAAEQPRIRALTIAQGLASNSIWSLAEDRWGQVYVGTGAGVDLIDRSQRYRVLHLSDAQGLASGVPRAAFRDREGAIWFGMSGGLSRYIPTPPSAAQPPPIYLMALKVAGAPRRLPISGTASWELPDLPPNQNRIQVDFTSPGALSGESIEYQYRLEGRSEEWGSPGPDRNVDFANLAPGTYHFQVRAVRSSGVASDLPAELRFRILAPVWMRGWFLALASGALLGLVWLAYSIRLRHLLEVERIRTRIAADLHDDIGASLSRISILSEVVKLRTPGDQPETTRFLSEIADSSRELVDSMAEIVWSIDPRRDDLKHLLARVGQFASGALDAKGIRWTMSLPPDPAKVKLSTEQRRGTFLILKEAINNAVKHSGCHSVNLQVAVSHGLLTAQIRDDGKGMPPDPPSADTSAARRGRGLVNMYARAREMGGRLEISSGPAGTQVNLELPHRVRKGA